MKQREAWRKKFKLEDKQLYHAFSEFSALMMIHRQRMNEQNPRSLTNIMDKLERNQQSKRDYLDSLFPINEKMSSLQYNKYQMELQHKHLADLVNEIFFSSASSEVNKVSAIASKAGVNSRRSRSRTVQKKKQSTPKEPKPLVYLVSQQEQTDSAEEGSSLCKVINSLQLIKL